MYRSEYDVDEYKPEPDTREHKLVEWKLAIYGLFISLSVICAKVLYANRDALHDVLFEDKLLSYETIVESGDVMINYVRSTVLRSSHLLFSLFCGVLMSSFTWLMVYLDSSVPGVQPPTPFSPQRYKVQSGHTFHLGYIIAIANGLLVFILMLINGFAI